MTTLLHSYLIITISTLLFIPQTYAQVFTSEQEEMLQLVNELRADNGLSPLRLNPHLNTAAQVHSDDQAANNFLGHTGSDASSFGQRVRRTPYEGFARAENVAAGNASASATFMQWKNSADHLDNMLMEDINEMGIGHGINNQARYTHYWTQVFGIGDPALSIDEVDYSMEKDIAIYPNPSQQFIRIHFKNKKPSAFYMTNERGQIIKKITTNTSQQTQEIDVSDLSQGTYFIVVDGTKASKIVIL